MKIVNPILYQQLIDMSEQSYREDENKDEDTEQTSNKTE